MSSDYLQSLTAAELKDELKAQTKNIEDEEKKKKMTEGDAATLRSNISKLGKFTPVTPIFKLVASGIKPFYIPTSLVTIDARYMLAMNESVMKDELKNQGLYDPVTKMFKDPSNKKTFTIENTDNNLMLSNFFLGSLAYQFNKGKLVPYAGQFKKMMSSVYCSTIQGKIPQFDPSLENVARQIPDEVLAVNLGMKLDDELKNQGVNTYYFRTPMDKAKALHKVFSNPVINTNFTKDMAIIIRKYRQSMQENMRRQFVVDQYDKINVDVPYIQINLGNITNQDIDKKRGGDLFMDDF